MRTDEMSDTSPSKKRKHEDTHEENGLPNKLIAGAKPGSTARHSDKAGKRARVSYSCSECHRRKQKVRILTSTF
jgi:ribosomal protein L44E